MQVWDPRDGTLTRELFGHRSTVSAIREWQGPPRGRQVGTAAAAAVGCSASNQDRCAASGPLLLTGSYDGTVRIETFFPFAILQRSLDLHNVNVN